MSCIALNKVSMCGSLATSTIAIFYFKSVLNRANELKRINHIFAAYGLLNLTLHTFDGKKTPTRKNELLEN